MDSDFQERMFAKQIAVMKGQAWNVVETLKTPDHGPLELTRRARVCVWDDLVDVPIAVPLRTPPPETSDFSRRHAPDDPENTRNGHVRAQSHSQFNVSRQADDMLQNNPLTTNATPNNRITHVRAGSDLTKSNMSFSSRPINPSRVSFDAYSRPMPHHQKYRRHSVSTNNNKQHLDERGGGLITLFDEMLNDDPDAGDLGYGAVEESQRRTRKVIVERLEAVKSTPVFTWC